jgi:hypothetical protein
LIDVFDAPVCVKYVVGELKSYLLVRPAAFVERDRHGSGFEVDAVDGIDQAVEEFPHSFEVKVRRLVPI